MIGHDGLTPCRVIHCNRGSRKVERILTNIELSSKIQWIQKINQIYNKKNMTVKRT